MTGNCRPIAFRRGGAFWRGLAADPAAGPVLAELCGALDAPDTALCKDRPKIKAGCRENRFIKRYNLPGFWTQFRRRFRTPRPFRALAGAEHLAALGLETPRVVAALVETRNWVRREFLITELLPPGVELLSEAVARKGADRRRLWELVLAELLPRVAALHDSGWVHGDLSLRNVYFHPDTGRCGFLDLDGAARRGRRGAPTGLREKETARVVSSFVLYARDPGSAATLLREAAERYADCSGVRLDPARLGRHLEHFIEHARRRQ